MWKSNWAEDVIKRHPDTKKSLQLSYELNPMDFILWAAALYLLDGSVEVPKPEKHPILIPTNSGNQLTRIIKIPSIDCFNDDYPEVNCFIGVCMDGNMEGIVVVVVDAKISEVRGSLPKINISTLLIDAFTTRKDETNDNQM